LSTAPHRLGKYEIQQFLGKGNVGEVWKAHDLSNKRDVALKTVYADLQRSDPQFLTRFMNDGQVLVTLRHANLVPVLEVNVARQEQSSEITAYLVMEYIVGQTFANYLQNTSHQGNFPALSAISRFFTSLGLALDYAYQREIVHGNLTTDNILLNRQDTSQFPGGEPMLTDIGLAQLLGLAANTYTKVPLYLSPEQAQGRPPSPRSDVYALGVILYEIYTGTVPFHGESSIAVMSQHMQSLPTPPALINPIVPSGLSEVILRALAKDPSSRYPNVSAFAAAIASASTRLSSISISPETARKDIPLPSGPGNSLLGVAQPPPVPGSSQFRFSGRPSLSGLTPKEVPGYVPELPSTPPSLLSQAQPTVTSPAPSEANKAVQSARPPIPTASSPLPAVQPQGLETSLPPQTPVPVEPKKPDSHTQAISLSAILQTQQVPTSSVDANAAPTLYRQPGSPSPAPPGLQTSQSPSLPQPLQTYPPGSGATTSQPVNPQYQQQNRTAPPPGLQTPPGQAQRLRPISARPQQRKPKKTSWYIALAALLALVVIGGSLGAIFFLNKGNVNPIASGNGSSRVFFQDGTQHSDQLHFDVQNVAPPPDGQTYFAWLQDTAQQTRPLGALAVHNGRISFIYQGDGKTNLIAITQGILITTEDIGKTPQGPGDHKVYQASFDPALLDGLRSLLYATPGLPDQQSVVAVILDTLHSIDDKAGSIVDTLHSDSPLAKRQAIRVLELLENTQQAQSSGDLPAKYSSQINVPIGLLSSPSQPGYLDILDMQLKQLEPLVAQNTAAQQHLSNVKSALGDLRDWLQKMHDYDVQLLKAADLQDPAMSGVALQLKQVAADSFTGRTIPPNASPQPAPGSAGAQQAYTEAQYMATLTLQSTLP
jgi:serine/threonine protein kinase